MAFVEIGRWVAPQGEVAALASGPREPDLVRWIDGTLPELDERQRRLISGGGALIVAAFVLQALASGMISGAMAERYDAIEVLRLVDPIPVRPPGPALARQATAGGEDSASPSSPPQLPPALASPSPPPSILRWSVRPIPRRTGGSSTGRSGNTGNAGVGAGGGGVYDPYAGAAPQRRAAAPGQVNGDPIPLPPGNTSRLTESARARLAPWNGLLRCVIRVNEGRVAAAECRHRQSLALPAGLGARLVGLSVGPLAEDDVQWSAEL